MRWWSREILQSLLQPLTYILLELHIILISLIIYKPSTLIISPQTFSTQLGAGILLVCLSQCAILFYTLSPELLLKVFPGLNRENTSIRFLMEHVFRPLGGATTFEEYESLENFLLFVVELFWGQVNVEGTGVQKHMAVVIFSAEVQRTRELGTCSSRWQSRGDSIGRRGVFGMGRGGGLATSYVSCCSWAIRAASIVLMLFLETFCFSVSLWRWCCRYSKVSATPWGVFRDNNNRDQRELITKQK